MYEENYGGENDPVTGVNTRDWQRFLARNLVPIGCACDDGDFGPATKAATKFFHETYVGKDSVDPQGRILLSTLAAANMGVGFEKNKFSDPTQTAPLTAEEKTWGCTKMLSPIPRLPMDDEYEPGGIDYGKLSSAGPITEERSVACAQRRSTPSTDTTGTGVATSYDAAGAPITQGPLGAIADAVFTPRGIIIGVSSVALLVGVVALMRRGRSPQVGMADYDPANWTW
jgi:hypothetical protein